MKALPLLSLTAAALAVVTGIATAATIRVPDEEPTIQAGIDAAAEGDTVLVKAGTYTGEDNCNLNSEGKEVALRSESGSVGTLILPGPDSCGFVIESGEGPAMVIEGFTVSGGDRGILCVDSGPTITDCVFEGNYQGVSCWDGAPTLLRCEFIANCAANVHSSTSGAGMRCDRSDVTLTDCVFRDNYTRCAGGGLAIWGSEAVLERCSFFSNHSDNFGGGVCASHVGAVCLVSLIGCEFQGNSADAGAGAAGLSSISTVEGCLFVANSTPGYGGAIRTTSANHVQGCTFYGNQGPIGGTICSYSPCVWPGSGVLLQLEDGRSVVAASVHVEQSGFYMSESIVSSSSEGAAVECRYEGSAVLECCDLYGNQGGDWVGCIADQQGVSGNFSEDPLFCLDGSPDQPYSLSADSPCLAEYSPCGQLVGAFGLGCGFEETIEVALDIKPGGCPNPLNVNSEGVLPVTILGNDAFDVSTIEPESILLEGVTPLRWRLEDVATPNPLDADPCDCNEDGPDGCVDLTLKFRTQEIVEALGDIADGEMRPLAISGMTSDGTAFEGVDCVRILKRGQGDNTGGSLNDSNERTGTDEGIASVCLHSIRPNPFTQGTRISYALPRSAHVCLAVHDVSGRHIRTLADAGRSEGVHTVEWDGRDDSGKRVASGVYFCRLEAAGEVASSRLILMN